MKDAPLLSVTKIINDESGICSGDLCDFSIHVGDLGDFLRSYGREGAEEVCKTLDYLKKAVMEEYLPKSKKESGSKMKIKISKSQWEDMGRRAGWVKMASNKSPEFVGDLPDHLSIPLSKRVCPQCHGDKVINIKVKDLGTLEYRNSSENCSMCSGKGYIDQKDRDSYLHSMGVIPCPYGNDKKKEQEVNK